MLQQHADEALSSQPMHAAIGMLRLLVKVCVPDQGTSSPVLAASHRSWPAADGLLPGGDGCQPAGFPRDLTANGTLLAFVAGSAVQTLCSTACAAAFWNPCHPARSNGLLESCCTSFNICGSSASSTGKLLAGGAGKMNFMQSDSGCVHELAIGCKV